MQTPPDVMQGLKSVRLGNDLGIKEIAAKMGRDISTVKRILGGGNASERSIEAARRVIASHSTPN